MRGARVTIGLIIVAVVAAHYVPWGGIATDSATLLSAAQGQGQGQGQGTGGGQGQGQGQGTGGGQGQGIGQGVGGGRGQGQGQGQGQGGGSGGGAGGGGESRQGIRGRGISQHASALNFLLQVHGIHRDPAHTFTIRHVRARPEHFASERDRRIWVERAHAVTCSAFRYLHRLRELHPTLRPDYVEWMAEYLASALGEDLTELKAALLGYPHSHEHTSAFLHGINEAGCGVIGSGPSAEEAFAEQHDMHDHAVGLSPFGILQQSTDDAIAFAVTESGAVFTDYGISHTKEMHLIVVRDDLRHFFHLHPVRDAAGVWHAPFEAPAGGNYWLYADFVDGGLNHRTVRFERAYPGDPGETGVVVDPATQKQAGPYTVEIQIEPYSEGTLFTFHISDATDDAPFLEPYLGAMGHGILISPTGGFVHTHPSPAGDHLTFHVGGTYAEFHRIFTQFQVGGEVYTVDFDWQPQPSLAP